MVVMSVFTKLICSQYKSRHRAWVKSLKLENNDFQLVKVSCVLKITVLLISNIIITVKVSIFKKNSLQNVLQFIKVV